jgi:hypothetical protein
LQLRTPATSVLTRLNEVVIVMRIAVLSDTHGNQSNVRLALQLLQEQAIESILHCGDIDDVATVYAFTGIPTHFVLGNCDHEQRGIARACQEIGAVLHGRVAELELAGRRLAMIHGDDSRRLKELIGSGRHEFVYCGHTHEASQQRIGSTLVVNPGALHRAHPKTLLVLDLVTGKSQLLEVAE